MSLITRSIATLLEQNNFGTFGTDLFVELLPGDPAAAVMVLSQLSPDPDQYLPTQTQDFEIWVRNNATPDAVNTLDAIFNVLHRQHHVTIGTHYIYFIEGTSGVENYEADEEGRKLFRRTFRAIYRDTATVS